MCFYSSVKKAPLSLRAGALNYSLVSIFFGFGGAVGFSTEKLHKIEHTSISSLMAENVLQTLPEIFRLKGLERNIFAADASDNIPIGSARR